MVKTVRLNKKENYLIDKNGNILEKYDPNIPSDLIIKLDDSMLKVDSSNIKVEYGGQIVVQYNGDKFIIDDGYQNVLVKAGYIVYKDYDVNNMFGTNWTVHIAKEIDYSVENERYKFDTSTETHIVEEKNNENYNSWGYV